MADQYAVMRWLDDGNRLSVHSSKQIVEPKLTDLHIGCCGVAKYHGYPGLWKFRILKLGGKKELKLWLDNHIANLTADVTDVSFTETDVSVCSNANVSDSNNNNVSDSNNNNNNNNNNVSDSNNNSNLSDSNNNVSDSNNNNNVSDSNNNNNTPRNGHTCEGTPSTKRIDSPRITTTVDGTDSFQYIKETAKTDLYKEKIEQLEEDVRSIRRKYRRLEEKVNQLEKSTRHPASETPASDQRTPAKIPASENKTPASDHNPQTPASGDKTAEPVDPNQLLADDQHISPQALETTLTSSIKGIIGEQNIVKHLIFQVFTKEEIVSCTRTGKRTFKNMDNTRPSLDPIKFNILERVVLKVTSMQKASFHKKFENQQKVLRRGEKE